MPASSARYHLHHKGAVGSTGRSPHRASSHFQGTFERRLGDRTSHMRRPTLRATQNLLEPVLRSLGRKPPRGHLSI